MSRKKVSEDVDVFQGPSSQELGEERDEGVVYLMTLKRVRYGSQSTDSPDGHLRWMSEKVRTIRAGTLDKLVEGLAPLPGVMEVSQAYRSCFLSTYRCFADTGAVVGLLVNRYSALREEVEDKKQSEEKAVIKKDILSFLRLWLDTCPEDFTGIEPNPHLERLRPLLEESPELMKALAKKDSEGGKRKGVSRSDVGGGREVESEQGREEEEEDEVDGNGGKPAQSPIFSMTPQEFANALTSEDARLFLRVIPHQCLDYIRRPKDAGNAPTLRACIGHFNKVSYVVIATVLGGVTPDSRAYLIKCWLEIAQQCRAVKNFSSLKAIVSGLQSTSVFRLQKSWDQLSSSKMQLFEELSGLLSADDNHQISRELLNKEGTAKYADVQSKKKGKRHEKHHSLVGVVPYLGTFLTDLTMMHTAYPDKTEDGLINFEKFRKQFELLAQLTLYQKSAANYCFEDSHQLLRWLRRTHTLSPSDSHTLSKDLEPDSPSPPAGHCRGSMLVVPNIVMTTSPLPMSPMKKRRHHHILHKLGVKGSTVGDYSPAMHQKSRSAHSSPTHTSDSSLQIAGNLTSSISASDITKLDYSAGNTATLKVGRSISVTPDVSRRRMSMPQDFRTSESGGRIVRVAMDSNDNCIYKSLLVTPSDKGYRIIEQSLMKHNLPGVDGSQFELTQVIKGKKRPQIPRNGNVFYALDTTSHPITLLLSPKTSK